MCFYVWLGYDVYLCAFCVQADEEDEDEDEAEENEGGEDDGGLPGEKDKILKLGQVRTDKIFKQATNSAR